MKRDFSFITLALWILLPPLWIIYQQTLTIASNLETVTESPSKSTTVESRISFEKTVFDLGDVGQGTKNSCEFRFTNTGRGLLKIGNISRTCGCTVIQFDKKEYAPDETGTIKVIYSAGSSTGTRNLCKTALICV